MRAHGVIRHGTAPQARRARTSAHSDRLQPPHVMKIVSPQTTHKSVPSSFFSGEKRHGSDFAARGFAAGGFAAGGFIARGFAAGGFAASGFSLASIAFALGLRRRTGCCSTAATHCCVNDGISPSSDDDVSPPSSTSLNDGMFGM